MTIDLAGRRVMVTGGAGFLGRNIVRELAARDARVSVPRSRDYDLSTREGIRAALKQYEPEIIIHCAALAGGIGANRANPGRFFYANAIMGIELIEQAYRAGVQRFVTIGTVCSYPKVLPAPFREEDLWTGYPEETNAPYGLAKKMLLVQGQAYRDEYGFDVIHLLPTNLYGPDDNFDPRTSHVIPALIRKCLEARAAGEPVVEAWGSGRPSREFLHVRDAGRAIVMATSTYDGREPVNVGSGREVTIRELAGLIGRLTGFDGEFRWNETMPDGQPRRVLDTSRAAQEFGFNAEIPLEDGLRETIDSYARSAAAGR